MNFDVNFFFEKVKMVVKNHGKIKWMGNSFVGIEIFTFFYCTFFAIYIPAVEEVRIQFSV